MQPLAGKSSSSGQRLPQLQVTLTVKIRGLDVACAGGVGRSKHKDVARDFFVLLQPDNVYVMRLISVWRNSGTSNTKVLRLNDALLALPHGIVLAFIRLLIRLVAIVIINCFLR